ncbi:hypothetical protein [Xylanimonas allomyrinae]|uniref:hypothetical protein n=1 Tax=Xylanimonas allomyrinae TaxID=2509459 RepID=UPI001B8752C2|nr:hypothetical protein [Xylanimonas allomyrinae]
MTDHETTPGADRQPVDVDAKLALDRFELDEGYAHVVVGDDADDAVFDHLVTLCPAGLYKRGPAGERLFDHAGCLECGTCRIEGAP